LANRKYECSLCGALLDVTKDQTPLVTIAAAGGKPNMRTISVDGREIHRCQIGKSPKPVRE
jgi:hypothetical protein